MKKLVILALSTVLCLMLAGYAGAETQQKPSAQIYGSQLMTPEECNTFRTTMRSLKTKQERAAYRAEHHQKLQERAREMGKTLPDMPMADGACAGMHRKMHGMMQGGNACNQAGGGCNQACMQGMKQGGCGTGCCGGMQGEMPQAASGVAPEPEGDAAGHVH